MGRVVVKARSLLLLCGAALTFAGAAAAQTPPAGAVADGLPPGRILAIVRANGLDPMGRPARTGEVYVLRALDPNDVAYRVTIDARTGRTVAIRAIAMPGPYQAVAPYQRSEGPVYSRIFGAPGDDGYGSPRPPREVLHGKPPHSQESAAAPASGSPPQSQSSPENVAGAPLPRPRPYVMEATTSVPADAAPTVAPAVAAPAASAAAPAAAQKTLDPPKDNGGAAMAPIAPLE